MLAGGGYPERPVARLLQASPRCIWMAMLPKLEGAAGNINRSLIWLTEFFNWIWILSFLSSDGLSLSHYSRFLLPYSCQSLVFFHLGWNFLPCTIRRSSIDRLCFHRGNTSTYDSQSLFHTSSLAVGWLSILGIGAEPGVIPVSEEAKKVLGLEICQQGAEQGLLNPGVRSEPFSFCCMQSWCQRNTFHPYAVLCPGVGGPFWLECTPILSSKSSLCVFCSLPLTDTGHIIFPQVQFWALSHSEMYLPLFLCCCSVAKSCLTLWDTIDCSMPGFLICHHLLEFAQVHGHCIGDAIQPSHSLWSPSSAAFNLSQHQGLFQWVSSSYQVAKVLELQLQHQSFKWIFRVGFLWDWLVWSPFCPRDSLGIYSLWRPCCTPFSLSRQSFLSKVGAGWPGNKLQPQVALVVKNLPANAADARDMGSILASGWSPEEGNGNPLQYSCLENPLDRGTWWATIHGITNSGTQMKRLIIHGHMEADPGQTLRRLFQMHASPACVLGNHQGLLCALLRRGTLALDQLCSMFHLSTLFN